MSHYLVRSITAKSVCTGVDTERTVGVKSPYHSKYPPAQYSANVQLQFHLQRSAAKRASTPGQQHEPQLQVCTSLQHMHTIPSWV
jgi:hypothetical protein